MNEPIDLRDQLTRLVARWERRAEELRGRDDERAELWSARAEMLDACAAELDALVRMEGGPPND